MDYTDEGWGKNEFQRSQVCYSSSLLLNHCVGVWASLFHKKQVTKEQAWIQRAVHSERRPITITLPSPIQILLPFLEGERIT